MVNLWIAYLFMTAGGGRIIVPHHFWCMFVVQNASYVIGNHFPEPVFACARMKDKDKDKTWRNIPYLR